MKSVEVSKELTPDAFAALEKTGISRRQFIAKSGALIVGFSMAELTTGLMAPGSAHAQRLDGAGSSRLDSWIAIGGDGSVTAGLLRGIETVGAGDKRLLKARQIVDEQLRSQVNPLVLGGQSAGKGRLKRTEIQTVRRTFQLPQRDAVSPCSQ